MPHGFELVREQAIPELNAVAKIYRHEKTGAQLLSMENDDENKCFGINFYTPPTDSTGLPHIMEHSVLCGSRKYPLKEPFIELVKGSMNTFLNAFTYPDKTCYPVASTNTQDFYNLIDVYLDSVLHPLITPMILQQEGWHYELDDVDSPLVFKGVVFNEMKGAYSSPESLVFRYGQQSLLPDTIYGHDSGGDPSVIPDLTYEQFKRFHETYYHPSNAYIFFYGDDDPEERLRILDAYLSEFDRQDVPRHPDIQPKFDAPTRVTYGYDAGEEGEDAPRNFVTVGWLVNDILDTPENLLALNILSFILLGTPASPLRKALIDSGLGEDVIGSGYTDYLRQTYFSTGLRGVAVENADQVEALVLQTLEQLAQNGIEQEMIEAAINTIEFRLREQNTGSFPRGLALMVGALAPWVHGGDPISALMFEGPLHSVKARLANGERLFEDLIRTYLLNNPHRVTLLLKPDPTVRANLEAVETDRLAQARDGMSQEELQRVVENTRLLKVAQETPDSPEALAKLPMLRLEDLERTPKHVPLAVSSDQGAKILYHDLFTNGIAYFDIGFDLHCLPADDLVYLSLFSDALLEIGTTEEDYVRLTQRIGRKTGGIRASTLTSAVHDSNEATSWLLVRGKSTVDQVDDLLEIVHDVLLKLNLDNQERFRQLVLEAKADLESGLIPGGHQVVNARLRSHLTEANWAIEQMEGITQLMFVRQLAEQVESNWPLVLSRLEAIRQRLINRNAMLVNVTLDGENWQVVQPKVSAFIGSLPAFAAEHQSWSPDLKAVNEGLTIPAQVNYVGKGANLYHLGYELDGSVNVINNYLRTTWLWERVRVQGGAYGGFSQFDPRSGVFTYLSYRDPNLTGTLTNFDNASQFLSTVDIDQTELTRNIIGTIGNMDSYQLPDAKGFSSMVRYLTGEDEAYRQQIRNDVFDTTVQDFRQFAQILSRLNTAAHVVVLGSTDAISKANENEWMQVTKVL